MADQNAPTTVKNLPGGTNVQGQLFAGRKFWVAQRVPQRQRFLQDIRDNGGIIQPTEKHADYLIVDHMRKPLQPGSTSYKFIEESLKGGELVDADKYAAGPPADATRDVGSLQATKSGRTPFSNQDDRLLYQWVKEYEERGGYVKGNEIYKQLEKEHAHHTWQSWRDRWVKTVSHKPPVGPPLPPLQVSASRPAPIYEQSLVHSNTSARRQIPPSNGPNRARNEQHHETEQRHEPEQALKSRLEGTEPQKGQAKTSDERAPDVSKDTGRQSERNDDRKEKHNNGRRRSSEAESDAEESDGTQNDPNSDSERDETNGHAQSKQQKASPAGHATASNKRARSSSESAETPAKKAKQSNQESSSDTPSSSASETRDYAEFNVYHYMNLYCDAYEISNKPARDYLDGWEEEAIYYGNASADQWMNFFESKVFPQWYKDFEADVANDRRIRFHKKIDTITAKGARSSKAPRWWQALNPDEPRGELNPAEKSSSGDSPVEKRLNEAKTTNDQTSTSLSKQDEAAEDDEHASSSGESSVVEAFSQVKPSAFHSQAHIENFEGSSGPTDVRTNSSNVTVDQGFTDSGKAVLEEAYQQHNHEAHEVTQYDEEARSQDSISDEDVRSWSSSSQEPVPTNTQDTLNPDTDGFSRSIPQPGQSQARQSASPAPSDLSDESKNFRSTIDMPHSQRLTNTSDRSDSQNWLFNAFVSESDWISFYARLTESDFDPYHILIAAYVTCMDLTRAEKRVLPNVKRKGGWEGVPRMMRGAWTKEDDELCVGTKEEGKEPVRRKHGGQKACDRRADFLRAWEENKMVGRKETHAKGEPKGKVCTAEQKVGHLTRDTYCRSRV